MEQVREAIERVRRAEMERLAALLYVSWLPFISLGMYLSMITKSWTFVATFWALGFIPYMWTLMNFEKLFGRGTNRTWSITLMWFTIGGIIAYITKQGAWGVAVAIGGILLTSSLLDVYRSRWIDALSGALLMLLTVIGSAFTNPWTSFTVSVLTVYSFAALVHLTYGVYEVIPYVTKKD